MIRDIGMPSSSRHPPPDGAIEVVHLARGRVLGSLGGAHLRHERLEHGLDLALESENSLHVCVGAQWHLAKAQQRRGRDPPRRDDAGAQRLVPLPEDLLHLQVLRLCVSQQLLRFLERLGEALLLLPLLLLDQPVPLDPFWRATFLFGEGSGPLRRGGEKQWTPELCIIRIIIYYV